MEEYYEQIKMLSGYQCSSRDKKRKTNSPDKKTPGKSYSATNDPTRQGLHEAKQQALEPDESTGADTAKEGVRKAKQVADTIGDAAMETVDGAREAAKEANQKIRNKIDGPADTVDYRNIDYLRRIGDRAV
ncbi:hypothetical protein DKX38_025742 [Salix brachista]|uniref:Uncharacterized protein n=1 Tax=Salix brachista TaxID=2182728 RepID=A0A5N5JV50_9ROSI|nr:hypothetical protein DKX38_025742 [Salix brachista]